MTPVALIVTVLPITMGSGVTVSDLIVKIPLAHDCQLPAKAPAKSKQRTAMISFMMSRVALAKANSESL
jgi:hypothetical protein